ncbi:MAG: primosomal protein N' [Clostridia bacterium]|nr:primosomal protein N' [Clostridia bacterium]
MKNYALVRILDILYPLDREYEYMIPLDLREPMKLGILVVVPFGRSNVPKMAVVTGFSETSERSVVKSVERIAEYPIELSEEMLSLCEFIAERYFCSVGSALKMMIPPGLNMRAGERFFTVIDGDRVSNVSAYAEEMLGYIRANEGCGFAELEEHFENAGEHIPKLIKAGLISRTYELKERVNEKKVRYVRLNIDPTEAQDYLDGVKKAPSEKSVRVIELLAQYGSVSESELLEYAGCTKGVIATLEKHELVEVFQKEVFRTPYEQKKKEMNVVLSDEQTEAFSRIKSLMDSNEPRAALLYGVTGSGKTNVIISAVKETISRAKKAIVLVPEIGLASQAVELFMSHFGERAAVIHSALSVGERIDAYKRISNGDIDVVIGTRSAIFAPLENIGFIAIDEEQEHTYKSEMSPKYSAIEVAKFRAMKNNATLVLASATPSVETYYKAKKGIYELITLTKRYGNAVLPEVRFADLREDETVNPRRFIGKELKKEIEKNLENGEQTILFLNRRGYNFVVSCQKCGHVYYCPNCSVPLTVHVHGVRRGGALVCHYCGHSEYMPKKCKECGSEYISSSGYGTQMLEEELSELFPEARKIRMDGDTTVAKGSHDEMYELFRSGGADILYGTQMITKGLDFPNVTLVGIILADSFLFQNDFRAPERTFSMITQVIGRAGRSEKSGRAIVQTYAPNSEALRLAGTQDYVLFYEGDVAIRKAVLFPPFCDIALFVISGDDEKETEVSALAFYDALAKRHISENEDLPMKMFGPFNDTLYKLNGRYRKRIIVKFKNSTRSRRMFASVLKEFSKNRRVLVSIDINPPII